MDKYERSQQRAYFEAYEWFERNYTDSKMNCEIPYTAITLIQNLVEDDSIKPNELRKQIKQILKAKDDFQKELVWEENQKLTS